MDATLHSNTRLPQMALGSDDVPAPIERTVQEIVDLVPQEKREQVLTRIVKVVSTMEEFRGEMPHPQHAREYEEICPGAFDRMLAMRESELKYSIERDKLEQSHNFTWESRDQINAASHAKLGMWCGFGLGMALIVGAVVCGFIGQPLLGGGLVAASAVSMVPAFLNGRREKGDRREDVQQPQPISQQPAPKPSPRPAGTNKTPSSARKGRSR
jgi:uncharacterized membrane protein